ncbi:MAG: MBL fold metallo-hydrolase [Anaerolineales bacterium]
MDYEIHTIDLHHRNMPHVIAAFVVEGPGGLVLVETGPGSAQQRLADGIRALGFQPTDIRHVLVTHIHLDHAGAAGWWARQGAHVYVHHIGAPHLIDPTRLLTSARRIYGAEMEALWGDILPAPAERVTALHDGDTVDVCGLQFTALDTPGHARHHHAFRLGDIAFSGDIAGVRMPGTSLVAVPAPPPEFNLEDWHGSLSRMLQEDFTALYLTHFGRFDDARRHLEAMTSQLSQAAEHVREQMAANAARDEIVADYTAWQRRRAEEAGMSASAVRRSETANGHYASVDGMMRYWRKRWEQEAAS